MNRRAMALLTAAGLAVGLLAGCGIPDSTDVRVDGPGPRSGSSGGVQTGVDTGPPKRGTATDTEQLVNNFLTAAAGDADGLGDRIKDYIATGARDEINLSSGGISVVHLISQPSFGSDGTTVTLHVRHQGTLLPDGKLEPPRADAKDTDTYTMKVGEVDDRRELFVLHPPPVVLMTDEALTRYYNEHTIYFWNRTYTSLVPDLRYLPLDVPAARMPTEILGWLVKGPSQALGDFVQPLPIGTKLVGTAPLDGDTLTTSWSPEAAHDEQDGQRLAMQVAWSLWSAAFSRMEVRINGQQPRVYGDVDALRRSLPYPVSPTVERYAIYEGAVRPLAAVEAGSTPDVPLAPEVNRDLVSVAVDRGAKVTVAATVNTRNGPRLQVGEGVGAVAELKSTGLSPEGRPVWLHDARSGAPVGLVADAQGRVHRFGVDGKTALVPLPVPGPVTEMAASPEGQRLAVIAAGRLYIVPVATEKGSVMPAAARALPLSLNNLTTVAWLSETHIALVGRAQGNRAQFGDVSVDGGVQSFRAETTVDDVRMMSAAPWTPLYGAPDATLFFQAGDRAARSRGTVQLLEAKDIAGLAATGSPAPDAPVPSAPFYVY